MVAYLDFSEYDQTPHVQMLHVDPDHRRNGLGAALLRDLQKRYQDQEVDLGMLTQDGSALISSLHFATVTDPVLDKKFRLLARIREKLEALHNLPPEKQIDRGNEWNRLNDMEYRLEDELQGQSPQKRIIEHGLPRLGTHVLYNSMEAQYASMALRDNRMLATSARRFWPDGRRRKEDWEGYEESFWMKGISFTRDPHYALKWKDVTFALDSSKLRNRISIVPFAWNYHFCNQASMGREIDHKREREEFAIFSRKPDDFQRSEENGGGLDMNRWQEPGGSLDNLDQYLLGIMVNKRILEIYGEEDFSKRFPGILDHPKYKGAF